LKRKVSMEELSEFKSRTLKMEQIKPQGWPKKSTTTGPRR
jgi:hypothetical protein